MVSLVMHLVRGAYEASEVDQVTPEWPPHPARAIAALVDAADLDDQTHRDVLARLESAGPPNIHHASYASGSKPRSNFVVTNERTKESKYGNLPLRTASGVRTWPRTVLAHGDVWFEWNEDLSTAEAEALSHICKRVPYFGRSTSPAIARVEFGSAPENFTCWRPLRDGYGTPLRCASSGYLEKLERAYSAKMSAHEVPTAEVEYSSEIVSRELGVDEATSPYSPVFAVKQLGLDIDARRTAELTTLVRKAFLQHLSTRLPEAEQPAVLCGHPNLGETSWRQVMFLALSYVGADHADGLIKGIAMVLPNDIERRWRAEALRAWRSINQLTLGSRGVVGTRDVEGKRLWTLSSFRWTKASNEWTTVTPVVPSRFCSSIAQKKQYVLEECANEGLPQPTAIEIFSTSPVNGALKLAANKGARRPSDFGRPNFHARLRFAEKLEGPVVLGGMRHYGLGLLVPTDSIGRHEVGDE